MFSDPKYELEVELPGNSSPAPYSDAIIVPSGDSNYANLLIKCNGEYLCSISFVNYNKNISFSPIDECSYRSFKFITNQKSPDFWIAGGINPYDFTYTELEE